MAPDGREQLAALADAFDRAQEGHIARHGGVDVLRSIDEHNTVRLPLAHDPLFLKLATNTRIL